ncbi:hypothetical protein TNCV_3660861 [Trichonephila clavipes]|nr:hypothetical protein TNCV_3660861 [Trichonephila clavipes]
MFQSYKSRGCLCNPSRNRLPIVQVWTEPLTRRCSDGLSADSGQAALSVFTLVEHLGECQEKVGRLFSM